MIATAVQKPFLGSKRSNEEIGEELGFNSNDNWPSKIIEGTEQVSFTDEERAKTGKANKIIGEYHSRGEGELSLQNHS